MQSIESMIEALHAHAAGKPLKLRPYVPGSEWRPVIGNPTWNFYEYEFAEDEVAIKTKKRQDALQALTDQAQELGLYDDGAVI